MQNNGLEIDYAGYVEAYQADLIFTKKVNTAVLLK